jgi:hypothetical protein
MTPRDTPARWAVPVVATLAAASLIALPGCSTTDTGGGTTPPAAPGSAAPGGGDKLFEHPEDVTVAGCIRDQTTGWAKAKLTVKNNSSKASSYAITVSFQSADGATQYGEGLAAVTSLAPGQTTTQEALGTSDIPAGAQFQCKVTSAKRTEAF